MLRIETHAAMQLEPRVQEDGEGTYLALGGTKLRPPVVDDPIDRDRAGD